VGLLRTFREDLLAASAADLVMADLVDALIQERLFGFADVTAAACGAGWHCVPIGDGDGDGDVVRVRLRECDGLQRHRFARGPVLHGARELAPHELLRVITSAESPAARHVCDDVRTAVEHARVTLAGRHDLTLRPGDLLAGERLAATRGRPFHPTARAASGWSAGELAQYGPMRREPLGLAWVAVRAECLRFGAGAGGDRLADLLLDATDRDRLAAASAALEDGFCLLPVHPWQLEHVLPRAFAAELDAGLVRPVAHAVGRFRPTASLRTLSSPMRERHVKLPLGVATLGAARLLPPRYLDNGERAERLMRALLERDPLLRRRVSLCDEQAWCGWAGDEFGDRPGQLAAQLRGYPAGMLDEPGTVAVTMAALAAHEWGTIGPSIGADLDPVAFFAALATAFAEVGLGFLRHGVLPELHGQNVVVTLRDGLPERFVLRDHDTLRVHPAWMAAAGVPDPGYRIKPGAAQSLWLDRAQTLVGYLQTLGFQVNLYAIAGALGRHYGVGETVFWKQLRLALAGCIAALDLPEHVEVVVRRQLLDAPTWPTRQVLGPLLAQGSSGGVSMPAATGELRNPLLVPAPADAGDVARRAGRQRLLNAFLREAGIDVRQAGALRIALTATGDTLVVEVVHRSAFGHHEYGDAPQLEQAGGRRAPLEHDAFVDVLLTEAAAVAGVAAADAPGRRAQLATQIANSIARTARYVRRGRSAAPSGDAHARTRHAEQSLLFGHPFHPTPKSAEGFDDADLARYAPELGAAFVLHYFAVAARLVVDRRVAPGTWFPVEAAATPAGYALLPAHPWQARYLLALPAVAALVAAGDIVHLGPRGPQVYATSSVRTVCAPGFETAWKLALHVRITNYVRTNPVEHVRRATDASALVAGLAGRWRHDGFGVLLETGFRTLDPGVVGEELAADMGVLFREHPFTATGAAPRVLAGLLEQRADGEPPELVRCVREAGDVSAWLCRFLDISLRPLLTLFAREGLSLEAHVQNSLLCTEGGWPTAFWVRDMEGASASRQRLARNGTLAVLPAGSPVLYDDAEAWLRLRYHAVTNQLGHVVSVLGRHTDAGEERLWAVAREALAGWRDAQPYASELLGARALPAKANLSSRFAGRSERPLYVDVANPMRGAVVHEGRTRPTGADRADVRPRAAQAAAPAARSAAL
jgi:siderophore synthetase component